jgi:hypothetical protein
VTTAPSLIAPSSSSSSSSRTCEEKLPRPGFPFASMPVPGPVLEPSSCASSSSAAVRNWERCGVWAAEEEERLAAACVRSQRGHPRSVCARVGECMCAYSVHATQRKGRGRASEADMKITERHVREAACRVRGGALASKLRLTSESSFSSVNVCVASS